MKIIVVSGGFDPIHSGHIAYFKAAKENGDKIKKAKLSCLSMREKLS
jgi:cytidyltransferase-like protein